MAVCRHTLLPEAQTEVSQVRSWIRWKFGEPEGRALWYLDVGAWHQGTQFYKQTTALAWSQGGGANKGLALCERRGLETDCENLCHTVSCTRRTFLPQN